MPDGSVDISLDTLVALDTTSPFVLLRMHLAGTSTLIAANQMTPTEARELGLWLIEAAEVAEQDANLVKILRSHKMTEHDIQVFILELRDLRKTTRLEKEEQDEPIPGARPAAS